MLYHLAVQACLPHTLVVSTERRFEKIQHSVRLVQAEGLGRPPEILHGRWRNPHDGAPGQAYPVGPQARPASRSPPSKFICQSFSKLPHVGTLGRASGQA